MRLSASVLKPHHHLFSLSARARTIYVPHLCLAGGSRVLGPGQSGQFVEEAPGLRHERPAPRRAPGLLDFSGRFHHRCVVYSPVLKANACRGGEGVRVRVRVLWFPLVLRPPKGLCCQETQFMLPHNSRLLTVFPGSASYGRTPGHLGPGLGTLRVGGPGPLRQ